MKISMTIMWPRSRDRAGDSRAARQWRPVQQVAAVQEEFSGAGKIVAPAAAGEQTVMANAVEPTRQDVQHTGVIPYRASDIVGTNSAALFVRSR